MSDDEKTLVFIRLYFIYIDNFTLFTQKTYCLVSLQVSKQNINLNPPESKKLNDTTPDSAKV